MKVKSLLIIITSTLLYSFCSAQPYILNEILQLHNAQPNYSARSAAVGGAFNSLGSDPISLYQNPAGLGMYRSAEIFYGPGLNFKYTNSNLNGSSNSRTNFLYEGGTGGIVLTFKRNNSDLKYLNFGFAFHNSKSNNLSRYYEGIEQFTNEYGDLVVLELEETIENRRSKYREVAFAVAGNYSDKFFIGLNITAPRYNFNQVFDYSETDSVNILFYDEYLYNETDSISAINSMNIGIGLIYKINNNFRIGASAKSSSRIDLQEKFFNSEIEIDDYGYDEVLSSEFIDSISYTFVTAPHVNLGISYLNPKGFVAFDVGYVFNERFGYVDDDEYNTMLRGFLKNSLIFRVGGEYIPAQNLRLRAGYNFTTSPLQNNNLYSGTHSISVGTGIRKTVFENENSSRTVFADAFC